MEKPNYYDILGVHPTASYDEIKKARRKLTKENANFQSAKDATATERQAHINEAWEILENPEKRAAYDQTLPQELFRVKAPVLDLKDHDLSSHSISEAEFTAFVAETLSISIDNWNNRGSKKHPDGGQRKLRYKFIGAVLAARPQIIGLVAEDLLVKLLRDYGDVYAVNIPKIILKHANSLSAELAQAIYAIPDLGKINPRLNDFKNALRTARREHNPVTIFNQAFTQP